MTDAEYVAACQAIADAAKDALIREQGPKPEPTEEEPLGADEDATDAAAAGAAI